uniref:CCHC-type domain-containing protein n=1 Tax=Ananas comosus var. bracteatus TaxID=296719 RepID=A0A6V7PXY4_ANACO|nr:unnamed protein product [Ananas comosus var. bracteatus]
MMKLLRIIQKVVNEVSVQEHLNSFNSIVSKLAALDVRINEEEKASILLCSMPKSWDNLIMNLSHVETLIKTESVVASLLTEKIRRKSSQRSSLKEAMKARGRPFERECDDRGKSRSKSKGKKKVKCWNCGKLGHVKKDCRVKGVDSKFDSRNFQGNVAEADSKSASSKDGDALSALDRSDLIYHWILDSGASFHMTPYREWFHTYKLWDGGVIYLGDNTVCPVVGVRDVRIKMFDGVILTVSNVWHVLALRKSLLSVEIFCKQRLRFVGEKDHLKVTSPRHWISMKIASTRSNGGYQSLYHIKEDPFKAPRKSMMMMLWFQLSSLKHVMRCKLSKHSKTTRWLIMNRTWSLHNHPKIQIHRAYIALAEEDKTTSYMEACELTDAGKWQCNMEKEMESLRKNKT